MKNAYRTQSAWLISFCHLILILTAAAVLMAAIFALALTSLATATLAMTCGALATAIFALIRPSLASLSWR